MALTGVLIYQAQGADTSSLDCMVMDKVPTPNMVAPVGFGRVLSCRVATTTPLFARCWNLQTFFTAHIPHTFIADFVTFFTYQSPYFFSSQLWVLKALVYNTLLGLLQSYRKFFCLIAIGGTV